MLTLYYWYSSQIVVTFPTVPGQPYIADEADKAATDWAVRDRPPQQTASTEFKLKMLFGFTLLAGLLGLTAAIALGKIEEKTSYGLQQIIVLLSVLCGGFAQWAFGKSSGSKDDNQP